MPSFVYVNSLIEIPVRSECFDYWQQTPDVIPNMIENATDCETDMLDKLHAALIELEPNPERMTTSAAAIF